MTDLPSEDQPASDDDDASSPVIQEPRLWSDGTWTAKVLKNENDDGWAVAMTLAGMGEPALVGPWTMGRDKKNPKPFDVNAFHTLVKTANEVLRRHEQQRDAQLHKSLVLNEAGGRITVKFDIVPDEDQPYAVLSAVDALGEELASVKVRPDFRFNTASAAAWVADEYRRPAR